MKSFKYNGIFLKSLKGQYGSVMNKTNNKDLHLILCQSFILKSSVISRVRDTKWELLCVELLSRCLLVSRAGWFALSEVIAPFVFLSHAVHQQQNQENGEEKANHPASDDSC